MEQATGFAARSTANAEPASSLDERPLHVRGLEIGPEQLLLIEDVLRNAVGRTAASRELCRVFQYYQPNGWLKERAMRDILRRLDSRGLISLPPPLCSSGGAPSRRLAKVDVDKTPVETLTGALRVDRVNTPAQGALWDHLISEHHYLGRKAVVGRNLKQIIYCGDRPVACLAWADPCLRLAPRDEYLRELGMAEPDPQRGINNMRPRELAFILFNVKSRDLLYVDQPNPALFDGSALAETSKRIYEQCRVESAPFEDVRYFAPADPSSPKQPQSRRKNKEGDSSWRPVEPVCWEFNEIARFIPSLYDKDTWNDQAISFWLILREHLNRQDITTFQGFFAELDAIRQTVRPQGNSLTSWNGVAGATVLRWHRNFKTLGQRYRGLIATNPDMHRPLPIASTAEQESILKSDRVCVFDIQRLPENGQRLVFDKVVNDVQNFMEDEDQRRRAGIDGVVIFVDELNKFAPSALSSPLKSRIIDITARGRSANVALFGAEQFASEIDKQVLDNCATRVFGRTGSSEITGQIYRRLSNEMRTQLQTLPQGAMLIDNNRFAEPLLSRFPLPPCIPGDKFFSDEG